MKKLLNFFRYSAAIIFSVIWFLAPFKPAKALAPLIDYCKEGLTQNVAVTRSAGQTFALPGGKYLDAVSFKLNTAGKSTSINAIVFDQMLVDKKRLATKTVTVNIPERSYSWVLFDFTNVYLPPSKAYMVEITVPAGSEVNLLHTEDWASICNETSTGIGLVNEQPHFYRMGYAVYASTSQSSRTLSPTPSTRASSVLVPSTSSSASKGSGDSAQASASPQTTEEELATISNLPEGQADEFTSSDMPGEESAVSAENGENSKSFIESTREKIETLSKESPVVLIFGLIAFIVFWAGIVLIIIFALRRHGAKKELKKGDNPASKIKLEKSHRIFVWALIAVLGILLLAGGLFLGYKLQKNGSKTKDGRDQNIQKIYDELNISPSASNPKSSSSPQAIESEQPCTAGLSVCSDHSN